MDKNIFRATLQLTIMRREDILDELENTLLRAQDLARRENEPPLADLPALKDEPDVSISPGPDADDPLPRSESGRGYTSQRPTMLPKIGSTNGDANGSQWGSSAGSGETVLKLGRRSLLRARST